MKDIISRDVREALAELENADLEEEMPRTLEVVETPVPAEAASPANRSWDPEKQEASPLSDSFPEQLAVVEKKSNLGPRESLKDPSASVGPNFGALESFTEPNASVGPNFGPRESLKDPNASVGPNFGPSSGHLGLMLGSRKASLLFFTLCRN